MRKVFLLLLFCFSLISCKNFLDGSSIKKELDGVIAYEKAFKTSVRIMVDTSDYGDIYPPEAALIKGDALEITFTKKKDAVFKKWLCYSSDLSQIIEDAVTFTEKSEQTFDSGLTQYKVKAVLNKDDLSDIVIKPKCYLSTETEAPVINKLYIARTEDDALNGTNLIDVSDYESDATDYAWIKNHHVAKSVWVYFEGTDSSGCDSLTVTERLTFDTEGNEVSGAAEISKQIEKSKLKFTETGCSGCFEYVFDQVSDGIIELVFELTDMAGNSFSSETSLVKDSIVKPKSDLSNDVDKQEPDKVTERSRTVAEVTSDPENQKLVFPWYFVFEGDTTPYATDINGNSYYDKYEWTIEKIECWTDEDSSKQQLDFEFTKDDDNEGTLTTSSIDFLRKAYEDLYILITLKDSVGNIHEHKMDLYKSLEIRQCVKNSTGLVLVLNKSINERASPQVLVSYKLTGEEEFTSSSKSNRVVFDKSAGTATVTGVKIDSKTYAISELPEGEYKFSVQGAGKTYISSPWLYQTSAAQELSNVLSADDIPEITVTAEKAVLNAGKRRVKVNYQEGFTKNKDFTYVIQYSPDSTFASGFAYSSQDEFDIQNASSVYYFRILVYDQEGNYLASDKAQLDLSYDNIPPQISQYGATPFPEKVVFDNLVVTDSLSGLKKDSENKVIIQYFFSNKDLTINSSAIDWTSATMAINILYWDETENLTVYKDSNTQKNLYLCFSDNNSNYTEVKIELGTQSGESPQIDYNKDTGLLTVTHEPNSYAHVQYLKNIDGKNYEWTFINDRNGIGFTSYTLTDEEKESFVRVWIDVSNYFYFYPSLDSENYKLADLSAGSRGITVFTDQPCLVQTFYCTYDLGQDASDWINRGIEAQRHTEKTSFTYVIDKDSIPYTNYYTTVVQFADGTVVMSDVKQNY
ncbi:MAG: hypothetical protein IJJ70_03120 [Treponema sp.]|nr:hypothetical protein [Treponema sp.]MBR0486684.1 hypothetical protein [Treponema sp.]